MITSKQLFDVPEDGVFNDDNDTDDTCNTCDSLYSVVWEVSVIADGDGVVVKIKGHFCCNWTYSIETYWAGKTVFQGNKERDTTKKIVW